MPFQKGQPNPNAGRKPGTPNKGTEALRKRIAVLTEKNYPRLSDALMRVEADDPKAFIDLYLKLLQYTLPKLESVQQTIEVGEETLNKITVEIKARQNGDSNISKSSL
jgi:hypothetical protein